jgi:peptidoglycan/xylan/chitin deacetylase (PgdA/CDA1 family)
MDPRANCLTSILFHRFFFDDEAVAKGRDRLKRQCEWLRKNYTPLSLSAATGSLRQGQLHQRPLLITMDDALIDILKVNDIFQAFELPVAIFACVGWCVDPDSADRDPDDDIVAASIVNMLEWYAGPETVFKIDGAPTLSISPGRRHITIDQILANLGQLRPHLRDILARLLPVGGKSVQRNVCNWHELRDLKASGAEIGCHSISHVNLGAASQTRIAFEIRASQRILEARLGSCGAFAYPFGTAGSFTPSTTAELKAAGFQCAFLTHSDFADQNTDPYHLPRIALPDRALLHAEFCARVTGAGVALRKARQFARRVWASR